MIAEESIVKGWAISTESKIKQLIDDFIINYPQDKVRKTTSKLLTSLFKKGNEGQRTNVIKLLIERIQLLSSMGKSSEQFLSLITKIFELFPEEFLAEKASIFNQVWAKTKEIFNKITSNKEYQFYSLCSNMIDFGPQFKPYLLQANGCLKCFGRPDLEFQQTNFNNIRQELRVHLNSSQWVLKRTYEINNFQMNFVKKKINFKTMTLYYYDQHGSKKQLGKFTPNDNIPTYNFTTNTIGINFEFNKVRRNHISCILCSSNEEYASMCSSCIGKLIQIEGNVKVVAGNPQKINKELSQSFKSMNQLRSQLEEFAACVSTQKKISTLRSKIVAEMENCYTNIIQNLKLLRNLSENELKTQKSKYANYTTDCYSCHFFEFTSCINFIFETLKKPNSNLPLEDLIILIQDFKKIFFFNKIQDLNTRLSSIVSQLFNRVIEIDYLKQLPIDRSNSNLVVKLLVNLIEHLKVGRKDSRFLADLKAYVFNHKINSFFGVKDKIELFVMLALNEQYYYLLSDNSLELQKLQDLKRLSIQQYSEYKSLLDFDINQIFSFNITNIVKLYLVLIPEQLIPVSTLDIVDPAYLKFIKSVPPIITDEFIFSNIVFTPNPILKLNIFKLLPQLIELLPLEQSIQLIKKLCKYKPLWNTYIIEAVDRFDKLLEGVQKERRMVLCLQGYDASKQNLYFQQIFKMLTPQRTSFIIRLQIPQKEMQKQQKNKGGPVQYIYLPIRQVKSEDLKSDTIGGLHQWITQEIRKLGQEMPFDLIVENNIIDNLDLSLEIIYKKIVQKQAKRQIGNKTYDFFRVIYRIQGIFGEANERISGNPRDQKMDECITFSSHLLTKLPNKKTGLDILMEIIPTLEKEQTKDKKDKIIKILAIIFKYESIIKKIVEWGYGNYILGMAVKNISLTKQELKPTEMLLEMCSKIIDQANLQMVKIRKNSGAVSGRKVSQAEMDIQADNQESERAVKFVLERVKEAQESGFKHISKKLIKILPFCSKDDMLASRYLFQYFEVNKIFEIKYSQKLSWLLQFIHALSESYSSFKSICKEEGVTAKMVEIISTNLKNLEPQKVKENIDLLDNCFWLCKGLVQGDMQLQEHMFQNQILQQIYKVTGVGEGGLSQQKRGKLGKVPLIAFEIIKYFQEGKIISPQVHEFFTRNLQEKKKLNQVKNQKMKKKIIHDTKSVIEKYRHLMEDEDEKLSCSSCKEGYSKKNLVLGVYLYSTKIEILPLESWWKDNKKSQNITSTSYFQPIHLQCHIDAMKDDLKLQKTQWDGALVRNSDVLCNNWCPFKGPETTDQQFDRALKKYFEKNNKNLSFWIALNDLNGLLQRFAKEYNFAHEIKGSSYTHNAKLIPVLISITSHLLRNNQEIKYIKEGIAFIESSHTKKPNLVYLYFSLLLFSSTYAGFNFKKTFCLKLIENLGYGNFKDSKPFYVQLALIKSIMKVTNNSMNEGTDVLTHLNSFIPKNFANLIQSFLLIAEQYKNVFLKWETVEQAKLYFDQ